jgi:hypothetical protein
LSLYKINGSLIFVVDGHLFLLSDVRSVVLFAVVEGLNLFFGRCQGKGSELFQFFTEEFDEFWVVQVVSETVFGHPGSLLVRILPAAIAGFFTVHKADCCEDEGSNVPGGGPAFLVVVSEGGADGHVDFEAARRSVKEQLGSCEGIIFVQVEQSMVVSACVGSFEIVEAKVKFEDVFASDEGVGEGVLL